MKKLINSWTSFFTVLVKLRRHDFSRLQLIAIKTLTDGSPCGEQLSDVKLLNVKLRQSNGLFSAYS